MKNKSSGFSLVIELMIVLAIVTILGTVLIQVLTGSSASGNYTYGANGMTETRCINGLMFVVGQSGSVQQMIGESGGGISCK